MAEGDDDKPIEIDLDAAAEAAAAALRKEGGNGKGGADTLPAPLPKPVVVKEGEETVTEGIDDLRAKLAASEARNRTLEGEVRAQGQKLEGAMSEQDRANLDLVNSAIARIEQEDLTLKANRRQARANSDDDAWDEADDKLRENAAKLVQLKNGKAAMEAEAAVPRRIPQAAPAAGDPVEVMAKSMTSQGFTKSAEWIRAHPEFARDPKLTTVMLAAHHRAETGQGLTPDTAPYFASIEKTLKEDGYLKADGSSVTAVAKPTPVADTLSVAAAPTQRRDAPAPAAPVSRSAGGPARRMTLSPEEVKIAAATGLTNEQYALNKQRLLDEGKIGKPN